MYVKRNTNTYVSAQSKLDFVYKNLENHKNTTLAENGHFASESTQDRNKASPRIIQERIKSNMLNARGTLQRNKMHTNHREEHNMQ